MLYNSSLSLQYVGELAGIVLAGTDLLLLSVQKEQAEQQQQQQKRTNLALTHSSALCQSVSQSVSCCSQC